MENKYDTWNFTVCREEDNLTENTIYKLEINYEGRKISWRINLLIVMFY